MTEPDRPDHLTAQDQAQNWIDEALRPAPGSPPAPGTPQPPLAGPQDLRIPAAPASGQRPPVPPAGWQTPGTVQPHYHQPQAQAQHQSAPPPYPSAPYAPPTGGHTNAWGEPVPAASGPGSMYISPDVAQKRLIAGLLGIFLGGFGVHKFYLGITNPGIIMLAVTLGASVFGLLTLIFGIGFFILFLPSLVGLLGFVEGIVYLTKSDADFQREYLDGKKPWL